MKRMKIAALVLLLVLPAWAGELEDLRTEYAKLKQQYHKLMQILTRLQTENGKLKRELKVLCAQLPAHNPPEEESPDIKDLDHVKGDPPLKNEEQRAVISKLESQLLSAGKKWKPAKDRRFVARAEHYITTLLEYNQFNKAASLVDQLFPLITLDQWQAGGYSTYLAICRRFAKKAPLAKHPAPWDAAVRAAVLMLKNPPGGPMRRRRSTYLDQSRSLGTLNDVGRICHQAATATGELRYRTMALRYYRQSIRRDPEQPIIWHWIRELETEKKGD